MPRFASWSPIGYGGIPGPPERKTPVLSASNWRSFEILCALLAAPKTMPSRISAANLDPAWLDPAGLDTAGLDLAGLDPADWGRIIVLAEAERVAAELHPALDRRGLLPLLPAAIRARLFALHRVNHRRNEAIRSEAIEAGAALAAATIDAAILKGGARLFDEAGPGFGARYLSDIDLVVAPAAVADADRTLRAAGFRPTEQEARFSAHFHVVPLARPGDPVSLELHRDIGWQRDMLGAGELLAAARPVTAGGLLLPSLPHRLLHLVLHAQIQDMGLAAGDLRLRDLCELDYLTRRCGASFDWTGFAADCRARGLQGALAALFGLAHRLLGVPLPSPFAGGSGTRFHVARALLQRRLPLGGWITHQSRRIAFALDRRRNLYEGGHPEAAGFSRLLQINRGRARFMARRLLGRRRSAGSRHP